MKYPKKPVSGFTTRSNKLSLVLQNDIEVSEVYLVSSPPDDIPIKLPYQCIWDTGATNSVISKKVVEELQLKPSGRVKVNVVGPSDEDKHYETSTYLVNLFLPSKVVIYAKVAEGSITGCDVLIGMDVITLGDFAVTNHNNKTTWSFRVPSCDEIDFIKDIVAHNKKFKSPEQRRKERNKRKSQKRKK